MTLWFHPECAAHKRPQSLLDGLAQATESVPDRERLESVARKGVAHRRLPRIDGAERAKSGQATCRSCRQAIERGTWRVRLVFYEEGRFIPAGFVHLGCRQAYFETDDILDAALHFSPDLGDEERAALRSELGLTA